ncbi:hypothetical protein RMATCC62417_00406 [Rhizopus microsporus]|nr:hypothetical protein RMATCC62417_00406 [Rhizopus microsporus]
MFSRTNPFDECVAAATDENLTGENWELILTVTDKLSRASTESARDCIAAVEKRLNNRNPNVQLYALALTEALVKNCDLIVHREISSRSFTNTLVKLVHDRNVHSKVRVRILELIQMCSFEFRADSTLGLMNEVYHSLRAEGVPFPSPQKPKKEFTQSELDKQKEEEELQLALALSLSESENNKRAGFKSSTTATTTTTTTTTSTTNNTQSTNTNKNDNQPQISRVRALYDFQPTEQGELGFEKGDIIRVIESVYRDWWKGELRGRTGIFPVNYVEKIVDPSPSDIQKEASIENEVLNQTNSIDRLLELLTNPDPRLRDSFSDNDELQSLYNNALSIRPKLVKLIEKYSLKKDELVALNEKFIQARRMYDTMLSNSLARYSNVQSPYGYPPTGQPFSYEPQYYNYQSFAPPSQPQSFNYQSSAPQPPTPVQSNATPVQAPAGYYNEPVHQPPTTIAPPSQQLLQQPQQQSIGDNQYQSAYDQNKQPPLQQQHSEFSALYQNIPEQTSSQAPPLQQQQPLQPPPPQQQQQQQQPQQQPQQPFAPYPPYQSPMSFPSANPAAPIYPGQQQQQAYTNNY